MRYCNVKTSNADNQKWLDDRIEAYLDDDLPEEERRQVERLLDDNVPGRQSLSWAITIRDELRALPTPACSPDLQKNIMKEVRREAWSGYRTRFRSGFALFLQGPFAKQWRPAIATLMLLVVATVVVFVINRPNLPEPSQEISQAEVDQALAEAKWALGYVSKTGRLTGTSMQDALAPLMKEKTKD